MKKIPVSIPFIDEKETNEILKAMSYKAISGFFGNELKQFEKGFAKYSDTDFGVTTSSGTTALHLALATLSVSRGDEVLVSTLTNMATFFAVLYQGAIPIPIDIEEETYNIDPQKVEEKITSKTKAIIVVHLFGHPVDMDPIIYIAKKYNLKIVEDCAEAHGATYNNKKVGSLGDIGCFSFYANKIITTGEGGMLTTNSSELEKKARGLKSLAFGKTNKFMHSDIGFNYRMTNIQAAIGCAQLKKIDFIIQSKIKIAKEYNYYLKKDPSFNLPVEKKYAKNVYWMYHISLNDKPALKRNQIMLDLKEVGIESREGFIPFNLQEIFISKGLVDPSDCPIARKYAYNSFYLPSSPSLTKDDIKYISEKLLNIVQQYK
jgi:perosamine synthetase